MSDNVLYPIDREGVIQLLRESLRIEVQTTSQFTDGDPPYVTCYTLTLTLDNEVLSEIHL